MTDKNLNANESNPIFYGLVKWFNIVKGFGFITRNDGGEDVFVHQTAIKSDGYRTLVEGERVSFKITESDKGQIAVSVSSAGGDEIKGATRKHRAKRGARKYTSLCFNCNKGGHKVNKCPYERKTDRTCHKCGSNMHIIRKCPLILAGAKKNSENVIAGDEQRKLESCGINNPDSHSSIGKIDNEKVIDINHNSASAS